MKQRFSLEDYLADPSRKVVTRDGKQVRIICTDAEGNYPIIGLISHEGGERPESFTKNGKYINNNGSDSDLFFAPVKKSGWVNLFRRGSETETGVVFDTKDEARSILGKRPTQNYITTVHIEWEE